MERSFTASDLAKNRLEVGDILLEKSGGGDQQPVGKAVLFDCPNRLAVGSNFLARLRPTADVDASFLVFLFEFLYASGINTRHIKQSTGIQNLDAFSYFNETVALPGIEEQRAIVRFLDEETAMIDALLEKKHQLTEQLRAQFAQEAREVFGQLEDTTITCLRPLKHVATMTTGITPPSNEQAYYLGGEIPWFGPSQCATDFAVRPAERFVTERAVLEGKARRFPPRSTLVVTIGASVASVAFSEESGTTNQQITAVVFSGDRVDPRFGAYQLKLRQRELLSMVDKTTLPILDLDALKRMSVWVPDRPQQIRVANEIETKRADLHNLVHAIRQAVTRLEEYRAALITAAVTGQIDVGKAA